MKAACPLWVCHCAVAWWLYGMYTNIQLQICHYRLTNLLITTKWHQLQSYLLIRNWKRCFDLEKILCNKTFLWFRLLTCLMRTRTGRSPAMSCWSWSRSSGVAWRRGRPRLCSPWWGSSGRHRHTSHVSLYSGWQGWQWKRWLRRVPVSVESSDGRTWGSNQGRRKQKF